MYCVNVYLVPRASVFAATPIFLSPVPSPRFLPCVVPLFVRVLRACVRALAVCYDSIVSIQRDDRVLGVYVVRTPCGWYGVWVEVRCNERKNICLFFFFHAGKTRFWWCCVCCCRLLQIYFYRTHEISPQVGVSVLACGMVFVSLAAACVSWNRVWLGGTKLCPSPRQHKLGQNQDRIRHPVPRRI